MSDAYRKEALALPSSGRTGEGWTVARLARQRDRQSRSLRLAPGYERNWVAMNIDNNAEFALSRTGKRG
jgi:hypothetical protein